MGLSMSQRHAVIKAIATRYDRADKSGNRTILDELEVSQEDQAGVVVEGGDPAADYQALTREILTILTAGEQWTPAAGGVV